ncbi:MAG: ATP-dependent RecD-like DNA helicase [Desulfobacterales bacterium]|nr:ATP-dependent RecD-like DNA helicase [Desulfobacterales bacterium]
MADNDPDRLVELEGQIERITFTSEETGYTVAQVRVGGQSQPVTVVGNLLAPTSGEVLHMEGEWITHPRYGLQFKVHRHETRVPATEDGIRRYLGSGMIRGIGKVYADRMVDQFGEQTLAVIENEPDKLAEIEGIGKKRIEMIRKAWDDQKEVRNVMLFLQGHGISPGYAAKIFRRYGQRSIAVVRDNPYRLATDIAGIGFAIADKIAEKIGIDKKDPKRVQAGILHGLWTLAGEGHVFYPHGPLLGHCSELLAVDGERVRAAADELHRAHRIVIEEIFPGVAALEANESAVFLPPFYRNEQVIAERIQMLMARPKGVGGLHRQSAFQDVLRALPFRLARDQKRAVDKSAAEKVLIVTGGPGTGKTTIISSVIRLYSRWTRKILLAAPTGRAAKRMSEATGAAAMTIHRMLEFNFQKGGFQRDGDNPLDCDLLIVDEASMIDTTLMAHVLRAVPDPATVVFVGDVDQLPSVGPGNVLADMIASGRIPVVKLTEIFRQAQTSRIIVNAHRINHGQLPELALSGELTEFYFIEKRAPEEVRDAILQVVRQNIPRRFGLDPIKDIQVLTPMHKGTVGAVSLNRELQQALNPAGEGIVQGERRFRVGDKVMQIRNNYDREVFNGDIGRIERIDPVAQQVTVRFEDRPVVYEFGDLDEIVLAYAVSVHKSQGSEFPAVVLPVVTQHYILLQRNLIYTAVTRARELMVMVGTRKALAIAVGNDAPQKRYTRLEARIRQLLD